MRGFINRLHRDDSGAAAIEYGLICALIFLVIVAAVAAFAARSTAMYDRVGAAMAAAIDSAD